MDLDADDRPTVAGQRRRRTGFPTASRGGAAERLARLTGWPSGRAGRGRPRWSSSVPVGGTARRPAPPCRCAGPARSRLSGLPLDQHLHVHPRRRGSGRRASLSAISTASDPPTPQVRRASRSDPRRSGSRRPGGHHGRTERHRRGGDQRVVDRHALAAVAQQHPQPRPLGRHRVVDRHRVPGEGGRERPQSPGSRSSMLEASRTPARSSPIVTIETPAHAGAGPTAARARSPGR